MLSHPIDIAIWDKKLTFACHNLKGVLLKDLKQLDNAKAEFEAALLQNPDFVLADQNIKSLSIVKPTEGK